MSSPTERLTMAQALVKFLKHQYVQRDGVENPYFAGCFGIFGHGCVAGVGQALMQNPGFRYRQVRNEQASVHVGPPTPRSRTACKPSLVSPPLGRAPPT